MCGLVGLAATYVGDKHKSVFNQMLFCSTLRGSDATGVAFIELPFKYPKKSQDAHVRVVKDIGIAPDLISSEAYHKAMSARDIRCLIGHNRSKTIGENTPDNAHPFHFELLVGAHNGTLRGDYPNKKDFPTDSQALFSNIIVNGLKEGMAKVNGAYAMTWFDKRDNTLNFLRNNDRTLFIAGAKNSDDIYWASEADMLEWILARNEIPIQGLVPLKPNTHVSFDLSESRPAETIKVQEILGRTYVYPVVEAHKGGNVTPFQEAWRKAWEEETEEMIYQEVYGEDAVIPHLDGAKSVTALSTSTDSAVTPTESTTRAQPVAATDSVTGEPLEDEMSDEDSAEIIKRIFDSAPKKDAARKKPKVNEGAIDRGYMGVPITRQEHLELLNAGCSYCQIVPYYNEPHRWLNYKDFLCRSCKDSPVLANIRTVN